MITNKDLSIDSENGKITLNGNKYDLGTQGEIDTAVKGVYSVMGQNGAKNLIPYPYYRPNHYETNGITFDVSSDGVITMQTDTSTAADASYHLCMRGDANTSLHLDKGTYILSGCDINAPNSVSIIINGKDKNGNNKNVVSQTSQYPNGIKFIIDDTYDLDMFGVLVYCGSGVTISSALTFKPMIRLAADTDNTYEPYAMTNKQLTDELDTARVQLTNLPTAMATGKATFPAAAIGDQDIEVQFPAGTFTSAPVVTATMSDTTPFNVVNYMEADLYVYNVTKDSFFIRGKRKNANDAWFANWIAVQM